LRKFLYTAAILCMLLTLATITAFADTQTVDVLVNGQNVVSDVPAFLDNDLGRTFVPVRFVSQALGAKVDWDEAKQQAIVSRDEDKIVIPVTGKTAVVQKLNEPPREVVLDAPARIVNDRTMVPLRFVSEALGATVKWIQPDGDAPGRVLITAVAVSPKPGSEKVVVSIQNFNFEPAVIIINKGETVKWINMDATPHTATGDGFDSGTLVKGATYEHTFNQEGTVNYICSYHPNMKGQIVVK